MVRMRTSRGVGGVGAMKEWTAVGLMFTASDNNYIPPRPRKLLFLGSFIYNSKHPCPVKSRILFLKFPNSLTVSSQVHPFRSPPLSRFKLKHVTNDFTSKVAVGRQMDAYLAWNDLLWEFTPSFLTLFKSVFILGISSTFDYVTITLLPLVVKLNHEVWQIRDHSTPEPPWSGRKVDQLLVL